MSATRSTRSTVTGLPTRPPSGRSRASAIVLGMGERVDVLITVPDSPVPLVALAEGKSGRTYAVHTPSNGTVPASAILLPSTLG